jgi:hypothetical protein
MFDLTLSREQLLRVAPGSARAVARQEGRSDRGAQSPPCAEYRTNSHLRIPVHAKKVVQSIWPVTPTTAAPRCAPAVANQCLPAASITALASATPCHSWLAAIRSARVPAASRTNTRDLHNAPFHYVIDKSRTVCSDEGTVGEDLPSRTRSSRREVFSFSRDCLFNTHGPQAIGRSATI